ncbi:unnamed protein product [Peniophora sp. CBMAI 1063]|nr:unnamed protein product [Peniophora sp. CBMAI 1063]
MTPPTPRQAVYASDGELIGHMADEYTIRPANQAATIRVNATRFTALRTRARNATRNRDAIVAERDALQAQVTTLQTEIANLQGEVEAREAEKRAWEDQRSNLLGAIERAEEDATEVTVAITDNGLCPVCSEICREPYVVRECGHTFCASCLVNWLTVAYDKARGAGNVHIDPMVPPIHGEQMVGLSEEAIESIGELEDELEEYRAEFTCPYCRASIWRAPVKNFAIAEIIERARPAVHLEGELTRQRNEGLIRTYFNMSEDL